MFIEECLHFGFSHQGPWRGEPAADFILLLRRKS